MSVSGSTQQSVRKAIAQRISLGVSSSALLLAACAASASAQMIPNVDGLDASLFNQSLTDAVTQSFRQRDRLFFEDGIEQFESDIEALQNGEPAEPILVIESVNDDWQQFETMSAPEQ